MKEFGIFFALQFVNYLFLCLNYRYVAKGSYLGTAWTDATVATLGFTVIQYVADAHSGFARGGYIAGGVLGAQLGLWLTRHHQRT